MPCDSPTASASASGTSRTYWRSRACRFPTRASASDAASSGGTTRGDSDVGKGDSATRGTSTSCSSPSGPAEAAARFFRRHSKGKGSESAWLVTDRLCSYDTAHRVGMPSVVHEMRQYANNRAEVSYRPTRQGERQIRRCKSSRQAQRFLSVHGVIENLFRVGRHLLQAVHHRLFRQRALSVWAEVTCT